MSAIEDLEPEMIEELKKKAIERDEISTEIIEPVIEEISPINAAGTEAEKPKKSKKVRSAAQIAAFEKAKLKRAENLRLKREQKEKDKLNKKEEKKIIKEKVQEELSKPKEGPPLARQRSVAVEQPPISTLNPREQVIQNHYYYYGVPPPTHYDKPQKKKSRKKKVVESSSSEEEEESGGANFIYEEPPSPPAMPQSYKELQEYQEPPVTRPQLSKPKLKFQYA